MKIRTIHGIIELGDPINEAAPKVPDEYGAELGISDKSETSYKKDLPESGPIGSIVKSAWANLNVPTRGVPNTGQGNKGCAAAVSVIFYRATGYPIIPGKKIVLGTATMWTHLSKSEDWEKITDWRNSYQPGDIILTAKASRSGHVGVVVENGKIISNSSSGFQGDKSGQIETNYTIKGWESVANRNPKQTALFRYKGKYKNGWNGEGYYSDESSYAEGMMSHIMLGKKFKWGRGPAGHSKPGQAFGNWQSDRAYDLVAPKGTPVASIFSGKIVKITLSDSNNEKVYGWHVTIEAESGERVFYTHLGKLESEIKVGAGIKVGDLIGFIGRPEDGRNWVEHVHVGILKGDLKDYIDDSGNIKGSGSRPLVQGDSQQGKDEDLISLGDSGEEVGKIQAALIEAGIDLPKYGIDKIFGNETETAVREFQRKNPPLDVDGIVGPETRKILFGDSKIDVDKLPIENQLVLDTDLKADDLDQSGNIETDNIIGYEVRPDYLGRKFKIYDKEKKKVLICQLQVDGSIIIRSRLRRYLGGTSIDGGTIKLFYEEVELKLTDKTNSIVRGITAIINAALKPIKKNMATPPKKETKIEVGDLEQELIPNAPVNQDTQWVSNPGVTVRSYPSNLEQLLRNAIGNEPVNEFLTSLDSIGMNREVALRQIYSESGYSQDVITCKRVSSAGAQGLCQFMPGTWKDYGVGSPCDPQQSLRAYIKLMKRLMQKFPGRIDLSLAGYNHGPNRSVYKNALSNGTPFTSLKGKIPSETYNYTARILQPTGEIAKM